MASTRAVYQERQRTTLTVNEVLHCGRTDDLVLNTAQMRDAWHVQKFRIQSEVLDEDNIIEGSAGKEVAVQKQAQRGVTVTSADTSSSSPLAGVSATSAREHATQHRRVTALQSSSLPYT